MSTVQFIDYVYNNAGYTDILDLMPYIDYALILTKL